MPGAGWNLTLYDKAGNAILTQDARQREQNEWAFNIPETLWAGFVFRVCAKNLHFSGTTPASMSSPGH